MSNSHECMRVNGEALHLHAVYYKSHKNLYQHILQVTCKSVSVYYKNPYQILHVMHTAFEHATKSKVHMINHYHHSTKLYWMK